MAIEFKKFESTDINCEDISDENGNILSVPIGLNYQELQGLSDLGILGINPSESPEANPENFGKIIDMVIFFLRSRFKVPGDISDEDILKYPDGQPFTVFFIRQLVEFFIEELNKFVTEQADKDSSIYLQKQPQEQKLTIDEKAKSQQNKQKKIR